MEPRISIALHRLDNLIMRKMNQAAEAYVPGISVIQGRIMGYVKRSRMKGKTVRQKDLEKEFGIARPTATLLLQAMEKNGYISRIRDPEDGRHRIVTLTEKGDDVLCRSQVPFQEFEHTLAGMLTEEEKTELLRILNKLLQNMQE